MAAADLEIHLGRPSYLEAFGFDSRYRQACVLRHLANAAARAALWLFPRAKVEGIPVVFTDLEADRELSVKRLSDAVRLAALKDPLRHRWIARYVRRVVIWAGHYTTADRIGGIQLSAPQLEWLTDEQLASVLVHEVVHLRISQFGVMKDDDTALRSERRCILEQAAFLRRTSSEGRELANAFEVYVNSPAFSIGDHSEDLQTLVDDGKLPRWMLPLLDRTP